MFLTVSTFHSEQHRLTINVDSNNQVIETNEGDNFWSSEYQLQKASCP
jgi:subtilase family serine protease